MEIKELKDSLLSKVEEIKAANEENLKKYDISNEAKIKALTESLALESKRLEVLERQSAKSSSEFDESLEKEIKSFQLLNPKADRNNYGSYKEALGELLRKGMNIALLEPEHQKALQVGNDNEGGFFVRPQLSDMIISKAFETSPIRSLANNVTISTDSYEHIVDFDDFDAAYVAELATKNVTTNTTFSKVRIQAEEMFAKPLLSNKIIEDASIDIEGYAINKLADKFARKEATSFMLGTGNGEAKGLLSYSDGSTYGKVEQVETITSSVIGGDDLINLAGKVKSKYHANGTFLMSRVVFFSKILTLKTSGSGEYLLDAFKDPKGGRIVYSILGYPVVFADDMIQVAGGTAFTAGQLPIMFGDFKEAYTIVDRLGISILRDPYTQDGAVKLSSRKRVGGGVVNSEAYKILKIKA